MTAQSLLELDFRTDLSRTTVRVLLALLLVWSFGLRVWYAMPTPNSTRFWDERYGLENLEPLLKQGQLRPVHGFHPGFSYLPHGVALKLSDVAYQMTGWQKLAIFDQQGRYTPTTYRICRTISALFGTLSLLFLFLIGRRLGGDRLGLWAAFLLSIIPWHLRQSVLFKADIALLFTVTLALWASLRAIERPTWGSFVATGVAIGLALSAKFNAGPVALPLVAGALLQKGSRRRAILLLACAAAASVVVFLALQPYALIDPAIYQRSMSTTTRVYAGFARQEGHSRLYLPWHLLESLVSASFHGPWIGGLALLGVLTLLILSLRYLRQSPVALPWIMMLTYLVGYTALYAIATSRPSPHNWLPVTPVSSLGAGWALLALWLLVTHRSTDRLRFTAGALAALGIVLILGWKVSAYTYRQTVPRTGDRVLEVLRAQLRRPPGRLVLSEHEFAIRFETRHRQGRMALHAVGSLRELPADFLDWSDAEVFAADRLEDPVAGDFYRSRIERLKKKRVVSVEPRLFHAWGPPLVALIHPLIEGELLAGDLIQDPGAKGLYILPLPEEESRHQRGSLQLRLHRKMNLERLTLGDRPVTPVHYRSPEGRQPLTTFRFPLEGELHLRFTPAGPANRIPYTLRTWRLGRGRHLRKIEP